MAHATASSKQVGLKKETVWNTAVVVDRFEPLVDESITGGPEPLRGQSVYAGRFTRINTNTGRGNETYRGQLDFELHDRNMGILFELAFGGKVTAGAGPYTHTFTRSDPAPSFTCQVGFNDALAASRARTYAGGMVESWEIKIEPGKPVTLSLMCSFASESLITAKATVSIPTGMVPVFGGNVAATWYGTTYVTKSLTIRGDNKLTYDERRGIGSNTIARQQVQQGEAIYDGDAVIELDDAFVMYGRFKSGTQGALVVTATVGSNSLVFTGNVELLGETPTAKGVGVVEQPLKFECLGSSDAAALTAVMTNSDAIA